MSHKIVSKTQLSENVFTAEVEAPLVARAANRDSSLLSALITNTASGYL
jgi:hypothetical protein